MQLGQFLVYDGAMKRQEFLQGLGSELQQVAVLSLPC
jgi:hypothetical protein